MFWTKFAGALAGFLVEGFERRIRLGERRHLFGRHNDSAEEAVALGVLQGCGALFALEEQLDATESALDLSDPGDDTHGIQDFRRRFVGVVTLCDGEHEPVALERRFNGAQGSRAPRRNGRRQARDDHRPPKRENRQRLSLCQGHVLN